MSITRRSSALAGNKVYSELRLAGKKNYLLMSVHVSQMWDGVSLCISSVSTVPLLCTSRTGNYLRPKIMSPTVIPSGPVTFKTGTTVLGTAQLSSGKAIFTTSALTVGSTVVKVTYNGNSNINGSSASVTQTVQP